MRNRAACLLTLGVLLSIPSILHAQEDMASRDRLWTRQIAGAADLRVSGIERTAAGEFLIAGEFSGTIDLDPGPNAIPLTASGPQDVFVAKLDAGGRFLWARRLGGSGFAQIALYRGLVTGDAGSLYVAGSFDGTIDFDPGAGVHEVTSLGSLDGFVVKLDGAGNLIWVYRRGGAGGYMSVNGLAATQSSVFLVGGCNGLAFCFAVGQTSFLVKVDGADGSESWALGIEGPTASGQSVAADDSGTIIVASKVGSSTRINKISPLGAWDWYLYPYIDSIPAMALDAQGNFYLAGQKDGQIAITKYSATRTMLWTWTSTGTGGGLATSVRLDDRGRAHIGGRFSGSLSFLGEALTAGAPTTGALTASLTARGMNDAFAARFDEFGQPAWAEGLGGAEQDVADDIVIDAQGDVYAVGSFRVTADFDPTPATYNLTSSGLADGFVWKFGLTGLTLEAGEPTPLHFSPGDPDVSFEIIRGSLRDLLDDWSYVQATCLGQFTSSPATDGDLPPVGDGYYYLARGLSCCSAQGFGDSPLVPDPRDDIAVTCP